MSERYSRLFTLPENLYAIGSPVVIAAGTLLKDNQTGKIVAQLKLRSISDKSIRAVTVRLNLFDTAGNPIGNSVEYEYLDLNAARDLEFGQKNPVFVPESKARSYEASVVEVVFADRTTWVASCAEWEPLPKQKTLDAVLINAELIKQYKITVCGDVSYYPMEEKDLWYCTCGALNRKNGHCHICHRTFSELQTIDLAKLARDRDARLAEEFADEKARMAEKKAAAEAVKKKTAKVLRIVISSVCAFVAIVLLITNVIIPNNQYNDAIALMDAGKYAEAIITFEDLDGYKDSVQKIEDCRLAILDNKYKDAVALMNKGEYTEAIAIFETLDDYKESTTKIIECNYNSAVELMESGKYIEAMFAFGAAGNYSDAKDQAKLLWSKIAVRETISAGGFHTVGLKSDGTVVAVGYGQHDVSSWIDIIAVAAGEYHIVGLKSDGTVVAVGSNTADQCDISGWSDIVAISAGDHHTVGLKSDGTVVAVGKNDDGQCDVSDWTDIIAISAGQEHTVGLKANGTVVAVGETFHGQCDVSSWTNIIAISGGGRRHTVGLKADGTVIAVGSNSEGQCDVNDWTDIVAISAGGLYSVGLKANGTVVAVGKNYHGQCDVGGLSNIVAVSAGDFHTVGLKANGTVAAVGSNADGKSDISGWKDIKLPNYKDMVTLGWVDTSQWDVSNEKDRKPSNSEDKDTQPKSKYCVVCKGNAQYSYTNPFSGVAEPYCYTHYREIKDTLSMMEEDVGSSKQSKHVCEQCSREGTHKYNSFTGQTEYYCTQHYEELMDMLESFGLG